MKAKKIGRPTISLKDNTIRVRVDNETIKKLDKCVDKIQEISNIKINRSQIIRAGIDETYEIIIQQDKEKCEQLMGRINRKK